MGRIGDQVSLKMLLLIFTLLSTALAVPAPCPHHPPLNCEEMGNGMTTGCGGGLDSNGCPMPQICLAPGESCPPVCPHHPHPKCEEMGNGMTTGCGGGLDSNGCPMPQICLAPGESCPPVCPHHPHPKCEE